jgi:hypothetical protein
MLKRIDNLLPQNFSSIDLESMKDQRVISHIQELADDDQYSIEPMAAREFFEAVNTLLDKFGSQINGTEIYQKLNLIKCKMMWQALPALEKKIKESCLNDNVLFALKNKIEIVGNIDAYLYLFEYGVGPDKEERQMFISSFTRNNERLGNEQLTLKSGDKVAPTLLNWLKDFLSYTDANSALKGASYELTQYMYSSPNVKALNPSDKELLSEIITIYNHLRHPSYIPLIESESAPGDKAPSAPIPVVPRPQIKPVPHGQDLETLRKQMQGSKVDIISAPKPIPVPPKLVNSTPKIQMTADEIKREVTELELPSHVEQPSRPTSQE